MKKAMDILKEAVVSRIERDEKLTDRQKKNRVKKELLSIDEALNNPMLESATVTIQWKKSATWGYNPHLTVRFTDVNGKSFDAGAYKCSGCGYDKKSTVFAEMMNSLFKNMILNNLDKIYETESLPYGLYSNSKHEYMPSFEGGVGMNCYYSILKFLGYTLEQTVDTKDLDVFYITKN